MYACQKFQLVNSLAKMCIHPFLIPLPPSLFLLSSLRLNLKGRLLGSSGGKKVCMLFKNRFSLLTKLHVYLFMLFVP